MPGVELAAGAGPEVERAQIGFSGLRKWVEVVIARKTYPEPMMAGGLMVVAGFTVWGVGAVA